MQSDHAIREQPRSASFAALLADVSSKNGAGVRDLLHHDQNAHSLCRVFCKVEIRDQFHGLLLNRQRETCCVGEQLFAIRPL